MPRQLAATQNLPLEWTYETATQYSDPFNDLTLDVLLTHADGDTWRVPAFWAGELEWRVRFSPPKPGTYRIETICSDESNPDLHSQTAGLTTAPYRGDHPLLKHGPLRVAGKHTFEHADGTPFFWLGDTWWMGLCNRLSWPDEFQQLTADRVAKGFSVIQIVAGLYPDMPGFDERGANEAGFPWETNYARINPAYFDLADLRIRWLVRAGLVPCIVGCWGYYLPLLGPKKMKQHWRYLIARWGAYPVVWCLAGEATMPYYLSTDKEGDRQRQQAGWTEIARYARQTDPYGHMVTIHPTQIGRDQVTDDSVLDFDMLQTGHGGLPSAGNTVDKVVAELRREPAMPVLVGEVNYEGIIHHTQAEVQRLLFWSAILSGAAGHTYGANGLWQLNTREKPYGPSPHGGTWGNTPWDEAARLPGSAQLGLARQLLDRYQWWRFEPHPDWVEPHGSSDNIEAPFAAGIPGRLRLIYFYGPTVPWGQPVFVTALEPGSTYRGFFWDPRTGNEHPLAEVRPDGDGRWQAPVQPEFKDWLLVLERQV